MLQAQQDAAAAEAAVAAEHSTRKLDPGQVQRLKARNEELMQRRLEATSAKVQEELEREARLTAIQEQVRSSSFSLGWACAVLYILKMASLSSIVGL